MVKPRYRCELCRHWAPPGDRWDKGFGTCTAVKHGEEVRNEPFGGSSRYAEDDWREKEAQAMERCKAYVEDASSYAASLYTKPDFGCVLFERLPESPIPT